MHWRVEDLPGRGRVVFVSGTVTETAEFPPVAALEAADPLRLDLAGVEAINSCGVREWIYFAKRLAAAGRRFELVRCSPAIVRQLNTISNFCPGGRVRSVMLPYCCDRCGAEQRVEHALAPERPAPSIEAALRCAGCGGAAEFDDIPGSYLGFAV